MKKIALLTAAMLCGALTAAAQNTENGHEYVDLGLPSGLKWATCNVGATAPEEYGDYYAWGETETKTNYTWNNYKWCAGSEYTLTKYNTDSELGDVDNKTTLDPEDDAAAVNWGGKWRMPTVDELTELHEKCTWTWTSDYQGSGIAGRIVTGPNGNSIFLPAAGFYDDETQYVLGYHGYYWSSSIVTDEPNRAWFVGLASGDTSMNEDGRFAGQPVRAVYDVTIIPTALAAAEMPAVYAADGRIVCAQEFRVFDLLGRDVTRQNGTLCGVYVVKTANAAQKVVVK